MPKKKQVTEIQAPSSVLAHAAVEVLEDGRVEARLSDHPVTPVKELVGRTTQPEAARFILNDLMPQAMAAIAEEESTEE
jgi:hypothetical protein